MTVALVARAGLEHGPADDVVGTSRLLVDQELHLHVDPAVLARQALDLWHVADVGAVHRRTAGGGGWWFVGGSALGGVLGGVDGHFDSFAQSKTKLLDLRC